MSPGRVLVTGMSGLIGGLIGRDLATTHTVRALNRSAVPDVDCVRADIADFEAIRPAFDNVDTVIHMAAYLEDDFDAHLAVNVRGTYNVFEAARQASARRIVLASSGAVTYRYETEEPYLSLVEARWNDVDDDVVPIDHLSPMRPNGLYGAAKVWGEALGRYYSEEYGLSVICLRIGRVVEEDRPHNARHAAVYLSHRDICQIVRRCVEAPDSVRFDIFYAVSDNRGRFRDIDHAREVIGYVPSDGITDWPVEQSTPGKEGDD